MIQIVSILMLVTSCIAHLISTSCPVVKPMVDFDVQKGMGKWYEIQRFRNRYEVSEKCSSHNSSLVAHDIVLYTATAINNVTGDLIEFGALSTTIEDPSFTLSRIDIAKYAEPSIFVLTVLDTDYDNFQVRTGCHTVHGRRCEVYAWIDSRKKTLDQEFIDRARQVLEYNGLPTSDLENVDQQSCSTA